MSKYERLLTLINNIKHVIESTLATKMFLPLHPCKAFSFCWKGSMKSSIRWSCGDAMSSASESNFWNSKLSQPPRPTSGVRSCTLKSRSGTNIEILFLLQLPAVGISLMSWSLHICTLNLHQFCCSKVVSMLARKTINFICASITVQLSEWADR